MLFKHINFVCLDALYSVIFPSSPASTPRGSSNSIEQTTSFIIIQLPVLAHQLFARFGRVPVHPPPACALFAPPDCTTFFE